MQNFLFFGGHFVKGVFLFQSSGESFLAALVCSKAPQCEKTIPNLSHQVPRCTPCVYSSLTNYTHPQSVLFETGLCVSANKKHQSCSCSFRDKPTTGSKEQKMPKQVMYRCCFFRYSRREASKIFIVHVFPPNISRSLKNPSKTGPIGSSGPRPWNSSFQRLRCGLDNVRT